MLGLVVLAGLATLALAPAAQARAPKMTAVGEQNRFATATWTLPLGVKARVVEIAKNDPGVNVDGYFFQRNLITIGIPHNPTDTSLIVDTKALSNGTYYVHVAGEDFRYQDCPRREWSDTFELTMTDAGGVPGPDVAPGSPRCPASSSGSGGSGGGGGGGNAGEDSVAPLLLLGGPLKQHVGKLFVSCVLNEPGTVTATGSVSVAGAAKVYRFKHAVRKTKANVSVKLRLRLSKKALRTVRAALKRGKRLRAKVTVRAKDLAGNKRVQTRVITLKA